MTANVSAVGAPAFDVACMNVCFPVGEKGLTWWGEKMLRSPEWCRSIGDGAGGPVCDREVGREVIVWRERKRSAVRRGGR